MGRVAMVVVLLALGVWVANGWVREPDADRLAPVTGLEPVLADPSATMELPVLGSAVTDGAAPTDPVSEPRAAVTEVPRQAPDRSAAVGPGSSRSRPDPPHGRGSVAVQLTDEGAPGQGWVVAVRRDDSGVPSHERVFGPMSCGPNGDVNVDLPPGSWTIVAARVDHGDLRARATQATSRDCLGLERVDVAEGRWHDVDVELPPRTGVWGRVTRHGVPLAGVEILLVTDDGLEQLVRSANDGSYALELPVGEQRLGFGVRNEPWHAERSVSVSSCSMTRLDVDVGALRVRVRVGDTATGKWLGGVNVVVREAGEGADSEAQRTDPQAPWPWVSLADERSSWFRDWSPTCTTGRGGHADIQLPAGRSWVDARSSGRLSGGAVLLELEGEEVLRRDVDLSLHSVGSLLVMSLTGVALEVRVAPIDAPAQQVTCRRDLGYQEPDSHWLDALEPGTYVVTALHDGAPWAELDVEVQRGGPTSVNVP